LTVLIESFDHSRIGALNISPPFFHISFLYAVNILEEVPLHKLEPFVTNLIAIILDYGMLIPISNPFHKSGDIMVSMYKI